jgi:hypothetical protein
MDSAVVASINSQCNLNKTSQDYQILILYSCISSFVAFGFIFGFILTKNVEREDSYFMGGLWTFKSTKAFFLQVLALIIVVGLPAGILILLIPKAIGSAVLAYVIKSIGATWAGFALILPMAIIQRRFSLISLHPHHES